MIARGSQSPINRDDLAADYRRVDKMIKKERAMRARVLRKPRRAVAVAEADEALAALERIGAAVRVELAAQARVEQPMLFELGDGGSARGDY